MLTRAVNQSHSTQKLNQSSWCLCSQMKDKHDTKCTQTKVTLFTIHNYRFSCTVVYQMYTINKDNNWMMISGTHSDVRKSKKKECMLLLDHVDLQVYKQKNKAHYCILSQRTHTYQIELEIPELEWHETSKIKNTWSNMCL